MTITANTRLQANEGEVAAKVMDGEAILINISTGMYHSMDKAGGYMWDLIEKGHSLEQIAAALASRYEVSAEQALADVSAVAAQLLEENLVVVSDAAAPADPDAPDASSERLPYEAPALNSFRDMSDLLAIDPPMPGLQQMPDWDQASS